MQALQELWQTTGFVNLEWQMLVMWLIVIGLLYLAIVKQFEPLLLIPIAMGALIINLPVEEFLMNAPIHDADGHLVEAGGLLLLQPGY